MTTGDLKLKLETRTNYGTKASKKLRKEGKVPTVIYGHGKEPKQCVADAKDWRAIVKLDTQIFKVFLNKNKRPLNVLIKEIQHDYLTGKTLHVDLQEIDMNEEITASVPIHPVGTAAGMGMGGILDQVLHEIEVTCLPVDLPEVLEIDISEIELNDSLYVKDVVLPENLESSTDAELVIFHVAEPKVREESETEEEVAVGVESNEG
jgi:large subunit ribosomal protein L25